MDLLPHPKLGSGGVEPFEIPCVADTPYSGTDFWDFPQTHGFGDRWITLPATRLAALAQSWLFFGTISEFLGIQIDCHKFKAFRQGFGFDDRGHPEASTVTLKPLVPLLDEWLRLRKQRSEASVPKSASSLRDRFHSILPGGGPRLDDSINDPGHDSDLYQLASFLDKVFDLAEDFEQLSQGHIFPIPAIILSVKVLCITLSGLCEQVRIKSSKPAPMSWPKTSSRRPGANPLISSLPSSQLLLDMFQQHGWCPFQVGRIASTHNYAVAYYLTRIYQRFSPERSHRRCSETECVASNITDLDVYQPRHSEPSCQCRHLSVHADQIRDIILKGGIPLVRVIVSPRRKPSIEVVKMEPWKTPFVVFSHVWENTGLGNSRANSLPKCQLSRLQDWAESSGRTDQAACKQLDGVEKSKQHQFRYFWIDSLCIPPGLPTDQARIQAINKIPAVFQAAERVIVLDQALLKLSLASTEPCELAARLSVSPWGSRCWTYLENSLNPERLEVRCAEGSFDPFWSGHEQVQAARKESKFGGAAAFLGKLVFKESPTSKPLLERASMAVDDEKIQVIRALIGNTLLRPATKELQSSFQIRAVKRRIAGDLKIEKPDLCTTFVHAWEELSKRSNTLPKDKHIILAFLLGFNTQPIQRLSDPEDRMAAILGNMDGIPLSLFLSSPRSLRGASQGAHSNHAWTPLFPSSKTRLPSTASSQYTNIRSDNPTGNLYFPNNRISRREVSTLIIPPQTGSRISRKPVQFRVQDPSDKWARTYVIESDPLIALESSTDESKAYCLLMKRTSQASSSVNGKGENTNGALFRIKEISTFSSESSAGTMGMAHIGGRSSSSIWKSSSSLWLSAGMPTPTGAQVAFSKEDITVDSTDFGPGDVGLLLNQQSEQHGPSMVVRVVYECAVTATLVVEAQVERVPFDFGFNVTQDHTGQQGNSEDCQLLEAKPFPPSWQMALERDGPPPPQLTSHIPSYIESTSNPPISTTFLLTALDGLVAAGSVSMSLAICFTLLPLHILRPFSSIPVVLKLTLHAVSIIQLLLFDGDDNAEQQIPRSNIVFSQPLGRSTIYDMLHLITVAIYTISRVISTRHGGKLNILDKVFIFWSFLGHTVNVLARFLVTRYYVVPHLWHQYLASFDDEHVQNSHNNGSARSEEGQTEIPLAGPKNILSPRSDAEGDDDLAAENFLIPPWDSNPRPLSHQQPSYGQFGNYRHQDFQWESPYDNEPIGTYPSPMEVYHPEIHSAVTPERSENGPRKGMGFGGFSLPAWSKVRGLLSLPSIMTNSGDSLQVLSSPTEGRGGKETVGVFGRSRRGVRGKQKQKQGRRRLRTDSMVVEAPDTEAGSEYANYDRTSWRSGDYLLGESRSGR